MKYGILKSNSPTNDEKSLSDNSVEPEKINEIVSESSSNHTVPAIDKNDPPSTSVVDATSIEPVNDANTPPIANTIDANENSKSQSSSQLPVDSVDVNQIIIASSVSETVNICDNQSPLTEITQINTTVVMSDDKIIQTFEELAMAKPQNCEAMICEVDGQIHTSQETTMEVSNEDENLEIEMLSEPATPNDFDMADTGGIIDRQDQFVKSGVNHNFKNAPIIELSRYSWGNEQKYLRGCIFSPDGTCILTTVHKDGLHIIELPLSLYDNESVTADRPLDILTSAVHVPEGGTVYDYCWYPFMNSTMPETCCFISTRQHEPLQLWDAFDGKLRCTYRGYDAVDEVENAFSVCFSIDGSQVIAGYKKSLKIFRTDVPGRDYTNFPLKSPASCLAINSSDENMIAIGSWNSFITFHDVRTPKLIVTEKLVKHTGGVTLMKFSSDGKKLITGARKDNKLIGWDVRNVAVPLFCLNRNVSTNQKIYFDMSWSGEWLISGDTEGIVHAFDLKYGAENGKFPDYQYPLHRDCCNGVSLHPSRPILATASGQHHFIDIDKEIALNSAEQQENSLIFWWCGKSNE